MKKAREFVATLRDALDTRDRHMQPVKKARILGRNADGTLRLLSLDNDCEIRGGIGQGSTGQVIVGPVRPQFSQRGAAGVAQRRSSGGLSTLTLEAINPSQLPRGTTLDVTATGYGFTESTLFAFILPDGTANPSITIVARTYVDENTFTLRLTIAADADVFAQAPVDVSDPGAGFSARRKSNVYGVTAAATYFGFQLLDGTLTATRWAEGTYLSERGSTSCPSEVGYLCPIAHDTQDLVGDGAIAWRRWPAGITVWDVEGEVEYTWDAAGGENVAAITAPVYVPSTGYLYWWTANTAGTTAKLWRGRLDLDTAPSAIATVSLGTLSPTLDFWEEDARIVATTTACHAWFSYVDPNPDGTWVVAVRATLGGASGAATQSGVDVAELAAGLWQPVSASVALGNLTTGNQPEISTVGDAIDADPAPEWPRSGEWWPAGEDVVDAQIGVGLAEDSASAVAVLGSWAVHAATTHEEILVAFALDPDRSDDWPQYLVPIPEAP